MKYKDREAVVTSDGRVWDIIGHSQDCYILKPLGETLVTGKLYPMVKECDIKGKVGNDTLEARNSPEAHRKLGEYVKKQLLESGVIPIDECNIEDPFSLASHIVYDAWRQCDVYYYADLYIAEAIKFPPEPITDKRFSLKAFVRIK